MNTNDKPIYEQALQSAETIFLYPSVTYPYEKIICGVPVNGVMKKAVNLNTTQAFGKKLTYGNFAENKRKAMEICDEFFLARKDQIIDKLHAHIRTRDDMDAFEHELLEGLQEKLIQYSTPSLIHESYNRTRKIIELYMEHIVSMADEVEREAAKKAVPLLFLPIDSWIIGNERIFDDFNISRWGLTRKSSFGAIKERKLFNEMQQYLVEKAAEVSATLGAAFHVIYFDVFWSDSRLNAPGVNLFGERTAGGRRETNEPIEKPHYAEEKKTDIPDLIVQKPQTGTSRPALLQAIIDELKELGIESGKEYNCKRRNDGAYILEARFPSGRRKNIVTVWPNQQGSGDIRIVGIGKYSEQRGFDWVDIETNVFRADLREAYNRTQR
jgi:hypothetical protein